MIFARLLAIFSVFAVFCQSSVCTNVGTHSRKQFNDYWYPNGAEISRFALKQARYGELHLGDAVLIFVTEAMNPRLQVKADHPKETDIPLLKLNAMRKFYTGIYPYSIMTSVFAPIDVESYPLPLKITFTSQEWCGQVFMQLNLKENQYQIQNRSYFESESDKNFTLNKELSEDALWTLIRIAPRRLPTGEFRLLLSTLYTRLLHRPFAAHNVVGSFSAVSGKSLEGNALVRYEVQIPEERRVLRITFEREFPYRIQEWKDTHSSIFNNEVLTTQATRTHSIMTDYWNKHRNKDRALLQELGLTENQ